MTGQGAPGVAKSEEHRARIAETMRAKAQLRKTARRKASNELFEVAALLDDEEPTTKDLRSAVTRLMDIVILLVEAEEVSTGRGS